jgi:hypothetical protein
MVELVVAGTAKRERERKNCRNGGSWADFWLTLNLIFPFLRP